MEFHLFDNSQASLQNYFKDKNGYWAALLSYLTQFICY